MYSGGNEKSQTYDIGLATEANAQALRDIFDCSAVRRICTDSRMKLWSERMSAYDLASWSLGGPCHPAPSRRARPAAKVQCTVHAVFHGLLVARDALVTVPQSISTLSPR